MCSEHAGLLRCLFPAPSSSHYTDNSVIVRGMRATTLDLFLLEICRALKSQGCFSFCSRVREGACEWCRPPSTTLPVAFSQQTGEKLISQAPRSWRALRVPLEIAPSSHGLENLLGLWVWICLMLTLRSE